jgi:hypothetical protein
MAAHAPVRTISDIDRQGHLIRNFLENDVEVVIFHIWGQGSGVRGQVLEIDRKY